MRSSASEGPIRRDLRVTPGLQRRPAESAWRSGRRSGHSGLCRVIVAVCERGIIVARLMRKGALALFVVMQQLSMHACGELSSACCTAHAFVLGRFTWLILAFALFSPHNTSPKFGSLPVFAA